jgi:hypothetical protein
LEARTTISKSLCFLLSCLALSGTVQGGVLVYRSAQGLQFGDAVSVTVNGKDKALSMGAQPKLSGPVGKLPQVKLGGALLKSADSAIVALYEQGEVNYLLPEGMGKNVAPDPAAIWAAANILYKKTAADKSPSEVAGSAFVAYLPDGLEQLVRICADQRALALIGGKLKAFPAQIELIAAVVKAYPTNAATAPLQTYVAEFMRQHYDRFESSAAGVEALDQGLQFAELSKALYPAVPEHVELRKTLTDRKAWLTRKIAILHAFAAAGEWDEFLLGDREFENYQQAFPEMIDKHSEALKQSLQLHRQAGDARLKDREYSAAVREFRLASLRHPSEPTLQQSLLMAWTDYSREAAIERQNNRKQLSAGERAAIDQALAFANGFKQQNKLDEALQQVKQAEAIDPKSLPILLKKAEILGARREFPQALAALDEYDLLAVNEEREKSSSLRSELKFQLTSSVGDMKTAIQKAWSEGNYHRAHDQAVQGLRASKDDPELLYYAGMASSVTRNAADSSAYFTRYLEISNTLDANQDQRAKVRQLLVKVGKGPGPAEQGDANWLSGKKLPKGVYYCPVSLAFQIPIERIEASNKFKMEFKWDGVRLKTILPVFEKADRVTGEKIISFAYDEKVPQVASVADGAEAQLPASPDPDDRFRASSPVFLNNPYADPLAIEKLTGRNPTIGIAGNRFFNPFVWEKVHYFRLSYDESGRVRQAREIAGPRGAPLDQWLEFEWNGLQLAAIRGYQGADEKTRIKNYERTMQYQDGRLASEDIQAAGKSSRIKYTYNGGRLATAICDKDATTDDRSRTVTFR